MGKKDRISSNENGKSKRKSSGSRGRAGTHTKNLPQKLFKLKNVFMHEIWDRTGPRDAELIMLRNCRCLTDIIVLVTVVCVCVVLGQIMGAIDVIESELESSGTVIISALDLETQKQELLTHEIISGFLLFITSVLIGIPYLISIFFVRCKQFIFWEKHIKRAEEKQKNIEANASSIQENSSGTERRTNWEGFAFCICNVWGPLSHYPLDLFVLSMVLLYDVVAWSFFSTLSLSPPSYAWLAASLLSFLAGLFPFALLTKLTKNKRINIEYARGFIQSFYLLLGILFLFSSHEAFDIDTDAIVASKSSNLYAYQHSIVSSNLSMDFSNKLMMHRGGKLVTAEIPKNCFGLSVDTQCRQCSGFGNCVDCNYTIESCGMNFVTHFESRDDLPVGTIRHLPNCTASIQVALKCAPYGTQETFYTEEVDYVGVTVPCANGDLCGPDAKVDTRTHWYAYPPMLALLIIMSLFFALILIMAAIILYQAKCSGTRNK